MKTVRTLRRARPRQHRSWNEYDRGGHWAAHDAPDLLIGDIRQFFGSLG